MKNTIQITYDCPLKSQLLKNSDGHFDCSQCQKKVHNFTGMDCQSFEQKIPEIESQNLCGMYRLDQVSKDSKLNWKTKLNFKYEQWRQASRFLLVPALILGFFIVITGCRTRHVAGKMISTNVEYQEQHNDGNNTEVNPTEK